MRLALIVPILNHKTETAAMLASWKATADEWEALELLLIDNGSAVPVLEWGLEGIKESQVVRNAVNVGVLPALQQGYEATTADWLIYTHNDVTMFEPGWDTKLKRILSNVPEVGVAGFYGAKGLGTSDIYRVPYQMPQLVRVENVSNCTRMDRAHGYRPIRAGWEWEEVAVMDGYCLIINRAFLDRNWWDEVVMDQAPATKRCYGPGFDLNIGPHHMYDNHTCLQALDLGFKNIVITMDAFHHGGVTDVSEDWNVPFGKTKQEVHQDAHYPYFYHYWMPNTNQIPHSRSCYLPVRVA